VGSISCPRGRFVLQLCLKTFVARVQKLFSPPPHIFIIIIINITNLQLCILYTIIIRYTAVPKNRPPDLDNSKRPDRVVPMYNLLMDNTKRIIDPHNIIVNSNTTRRRYLRSYIIVYNI